MAKRNRVIWGEGTFVRPQHFQQQQRHLDYLLSNQILSSAVYNYGLQSLEIDQELLNLGRISVLSAKGYLSDGTYFDVPSQDAYPNVLEIKANDNVQGQHVYLALPTLTYTINEIQSEYQKIIILFVIKKFMKIFGIYILQMVIALSFFWLS